MALSKEPPKLIMPKATAIWLVENTALTFKQIGDFVGLHEIEVQALANGEVARGLVGRNPIEHHELTEEELEKAAEDEDYIMKLSRSNLPYVKSRSKGPKYTPVSKRGDKPDAIAWIIKHHPEITDAQIVKLIGTTKNTINAIRERTHANIANIRPRHPAELGLCTYRELQEASDKGLRAMGKDPEAIRAEKQRQEEEEKARKEKEGEGDQGDEGASSSNIFDGFDLSNFIGNAGSSSGSGSDES